jgi:hypothetical protein
MKATLAHIAGFACSARETLSFRQATKRVRETQERVLAKILSDNTDTVYGRLYGFGDVASSEAYQAHVPLVEYPSLHPYIERIAAGEEHVLFRGAPLCLQPTSGTTSAAKLIPFTAGLRIQYQRAVSAWIFDMQSHSPALLKGKAYWSISPVASERTLTSGGIPVGFLDDTEYLAPAMAALIRNTFAVPGEVGLVRDTGLFRYLTMAFLLKARDLTFVSVWNPTFFMLLLDSLRENICSILADIERGELSCLNGLPEQVREKIRQAFSGAAPGRAKEIRSLLTVCDGDWNTVYPRLWPELTLISCWEDGEARAPAGRLRELFPAVTLQAKGLMATEAVISIPLHGASFPLLSLRSHFYEFIPLEKEHELRKAWELEQERLYEVVVTTSGGLYRYRLGDVVRVRGFYRHCPMLEFIGRGRHTSDFHGEKLHQTHVSEVIRELFSARNLSNWFVLLAPDGDAALDHYTLYVASDEEMDNDWLDGLAARFDEALRSNFHYDYCRKLGQLEGIQLCRLGLDVTGALRSFMEEQKRRGIREGDIKPAVLDNRPVWKRVFEVR